MAINGFMLAALRALSYADIDIKKNYKVSRLIQNLSQPPLPPAYKGWDHVIKANGATIPVRIFTPDAQRSDEILLFFHGGGWVKGSIESYSRVCADMARMTGRRVVSVDYRLAPEYPFPCAPEDCYAAAKEIYQNSELLGAAPEGITLVGDSAGGNLAAVVSLMAAQRKEFTIAKQILIYPATYNDHSDASPYPSVKENGYDYLLTSKRIRDYLALYIQNPGDYNSPYFAPLLAQDLSGQPDTLVITAQYDPLRDEGEAYAERLKQAGNTVTLYRVSDALHGFFSLPLRFSQVKECYGYINAFLNGRPRNQQLTEFLNQITKKNRTNRGNEDDNDKPLE